MAYVQGGRDPVGLWYETALPSRTRSSMRDTSHQSMGAQSLASYTHNMLHHFAENISDSKDLCSYRGIDRRGRPERVDYKNDDESGYDLPANFYVLDASYRMFLWTGDRSYVNDFVFLNFYKRTVDDYVERWQLASGDVMRRKHWLNIHDTFDPQDNMQTARGVPGCRGGPRDYIVGMDLLATEEYQALKDYACIETYRGAADDGPKLESALESLLETIKLNPSSQVEGESHYPEVLYRHGKPDIGYQEIMDLTRPRALVSSSIRRFPTR